MSISLRKLFNILNSQSGRSNQDDLLLAIKSGDDRAVEIWFKEFSPQIRKHISYKIEAPADVEDLVQETFLACLKHLPLFRGKSSLLTWMKRIANHQVADFYRKKYAKKAVKVLAIDKFIEQVGVEDSLQLSLMVEAVLDNIRQDYKELLLLKYDRNLSVQQIADILKRSFKSVEADLFRARKEFKLVYTSMNQT